MSLGTGIDEARLRKAFLEEAEELSQKLGDSLLALETDSGIPSLVNEVFRLTHSLKSESALMGFAALSELAHRMEDVLGIAREGRLALEKPVMDGIFAGSDMIAEMMAAISKGGSDEDFDTSSILQELSRSAGRGTGRPSPVPPIRRHGKHPRRPACSWVTSSWATSKGDSSPRRATAESCCTSSRSASTPRSP